MTLSFEDLGFGRSRVARRVLALFVLCALVPLVVLAIFSILEVRGQLTEEAHDRLHRTARAEGMQILRGLQTLEAELSRMTDRLRADGVPDEALLPRLRERSGRLSPLEVVHAVPNVPLGDLGLSLTSTQLEHLCSGKALLLTLPGISEGVRRLGLAQAIEPGASPEVLVCELEAPDLWGFYEGMEEEGDVRSYYCAGRLVASTDPVRSPELPADRKGRSSANYRFEWTHEGEPYLASARTLFARPTYGTNLMVVHSEPRASVLASVASFEQIFWLVCLLTFLVVLFLSVLHLRRTLGPLVALREAAIRFGAHDLSARVDIRTGDEIEELGKSFNEMAEGIQQQTVQLKRALEAKDRFLANMSHELRTPMTTILGYAELLDAGSLPREETKRYTEIILAGGRHMLKVIGDVLDLAKLGERRLQLEQETCSLPDLVRNVLEIVGPEAHRKGLELKFESDGRIPEQIVTDGTRLSQILINLIGNAIKFTERGRVTVLMRMDLRSNALSFEIADTGIGIPEDAIATIFAPFAQVDSKMNRSRGGTGLGLPIARELARRMGGDLTCSSRVGVGSWFHVQIDVGTLQATRWLEDFSSNVANALTPARDAEPAAETEAVSHAGARVLVAEDVAVNRLLIKTMLKRLELDVDEAENGRVALEKARAAAAEGRPYDLVLMDIQMPEMDGYEATRTLRSEGYDAPIVALTAHAVAGERERCLEAGCDDFVNKPIPQPDLAALIASFVRNRSSDAPPSRAA